MNVNFGIRLRELRKEKGLNQLELARVLGVSKTTICQYETNKQEPTLTLLVETAKYFNVTTDYLLGLENEDGTKTYTNNTYNNFGTHQGDVKF